MSRGHGVRQREVLAQLADRELSLNELRWRLWERMHPDDKMPKGFITRIERIIEKLKEEGEVDRYTRRLRDFEEVVAVFPYKTLDVVVKNMRLRLLPHLIPLADERLPYSAADNERYLLRSVDRNEPAKAWRALEPMLFDALADPRDIELALALIARGRQLFTNRSVLACVTSLGRLIADAEAAMADRRPDLITSLKTLFIKVFPKELRRMKRLSSHIHGLAELGGRGPSRVRDNVKRALYQLDRDAVRELPGHPPERGFPAVRFSPLLDRLLTREAMQEFDFVSLPPRSTAA